MHYKIAQQLAAEEKVSGGKRQVIILEQFVVDGDEAGLWGREKTRQAT